MTLAPLRRLLEFSLIRPDFHLEKIDVHFHMIRAFKSPMDSPVKSFGHQSEAWKQLINLLTLMFKVTCKQVDVFHFGNVGSIIHYKQLS